MNANHLFSGIKKKLVSPSDQQAKRIKPLANKTALNLARKLESDVHAPEHSGGLTFL
jgi:hypothetical protein